MNSIAALFDTLSESPFTPEATKELDARANLRQAINAYCTDGERGDVVLMMLRDAWVKLEPDMEDVIERAFSKLSDRMLEIERKPEPYRPDPVWGDE